LPVAGTARKAIARAGAVAGLYARSLYELAEAAGGRAKVMQIADELEQVCELSRSDRAFTEFLVSPIVDRDRRGESLRRILDGRVTDLFLRFMLVLNARGRLGHLEPIGEAYDRMVNEAFGRIEVDVYTPTPLDAGGLESLKKRVGEVLGKEPVMHAWVDPDMIGGLRLRVGDQLIDGSVAGGLRRLRQTLLGGSSPKLRERIDHIIDDKGGKP
jgi:F-type H+-transporting ATPase subunit delta